MLPLFPGIMCGRPIESNFVHACGDPFQGDALAGVNFARRDGKRDDFCLIGVSERYGDGDRSEENTPVEE